VENNEVRDLCINAAQLYCDYLESSNKGRSIIRINRISLVPQSDKFFKLELSGKIYDTDSILFQYLITQQEFDTSLIKIKEYDYDRNILIIKSTEDLPFSFNLIRPDELLIISDLKFLIKNIKDFYITNGNKIQLPCIASNTDIKISDFDFLPDKIPNEDQKLALLNIFKNPSTYIWGAPGTGKTKYVLGYSIIHYIRSGNKVAVFAPTNVALEQVLRGIIEFTDEAGIDRNKILRIGNPSRKFAEDYSEVCEVSGIQKKLKELSNQIDIIENILGIDDFSQDSTAIQTLTKLSEDLERLRNEHSSLQAKYNSCDSELVELESNCSLLKLKIYNKKQRILHNEKKMGSLTHKLIKSLTKRQTFHEKQNITLYLELKSLLSEERAETKRLNEIKEAHAEILSTLNEQLAKISDQNNQVQPISFNNVELNEICLGLNTDNILEIIEELKKRWNKIKENNIISNSLKEEYKTHSENQLREKLKVLYEQREKLVKYDTEERLKTVNLVGATLDGYVGRFREANLHADHYFVDEAGYACIIKALSVFVYNKPVTLLGDHMQLPPVFEFNENQLDGTNSDLHVWGESSIFTEHLFPKTRLECFNDYSNHIPYNPVYSIKTDLKCTHRFGRNLAKILDEHVYNNGFTSNVNKGETGISFIHAIKCAPKNKRDNLSEAIVIQKYCLSHINDDNFCILSPYNDQIELLKSLMPEFYIEERILTVHKSQGREWDTVLLSVCDTNNMWFTDTCRQITNGKNLINTAVSRARKELIIVCDSDFWIKQQGQFIQGLLSIANRINI
jgi:hypothetical protein